MTERVDSEEVKRIVGVERDLVQHWARAVSAEQMVYILHSVECLAFEKDLRNCPYSLALDRGIIPEDWGGMEDVSVQVLIEEGRLVPVWRD